MEAYERDRVDLPKGSLVEMDFEALQKNPIGALETIYQTLELEGFEGDKGFY